MPNFDRIAGLFRHLLTLAGAWLVSGAIMPESVVDEWTGGAMILIGLFWSLFTGEKFDAPWAKVQGFFRHSLGMLAGYAQGKGLISSEMANQITSIVLMAVAFGWSYVAPEKASIGHNGGPPMDDAAG
ncbi:MAG: hypothetical protein KDJ90_00315 [Nitratireductor sp.]|nr:hypothetical protein [Nitratireductor sp.]